MSAELRARLALAVEQSGLSRRHASAAAGFSTSFVAALIRGDVDSPTVKTVAQLASVLGVHPAWLAFGCAIDATGRPTGGDAG